MDREMILGALIVFLLMAILFMGWLYAHATWRRRRLREDARIAFAVDDDQQQIKAAQRKGLDKELIEALPIFIYTSDESLENLQESAADRGEACSSRRCSELHNTECPVCLSEFQHKEKGRELPNCKHCFHVDCIDMWLSANGTCPVCRASCGGGDEEAALQVIDDHTSIHTGIEYPTNVLFWGNNSRVTSRVSLDGVQPPPAASSIIQIYTRELPLEAAPSPASSSSSPSSPSRLNPLRRLLSREIPPIGTHSHIVIDSPKS